MSRIPQEDLDRTVEFIRSQYPSMQKIPLHVPIFMGNERDYLVDCIDSGFVSSVGAYVGKFEDAIVQHSGAGYAVATVNGTTALQTALVLAGVRPGDTVVTQPLTFVATANAISHIGATPAFVDCDRETLGMCPDSLEAFLDGNRDLRISACVPVHVFGHVCHMPRIVEICRDRGLPVVEDAAEALGSYRNETHGGLFGDLGVLSFNGNKTITTGGGGMVVTNDKALADRAKHITTTAKKPHEWEYFHDELGFNYRMPNINAALGCAQLERLPEYIADKRKLAASYHDYFVTTEFIEFFDEPVSCISNYWLNAVLLPDRAVRDEFLRYTNTNGVMTRPAWELMYRLPMYKDCPRAAMPVAEELADRLVNIPSTPRVSA